MVILLQTSASFFDGFRGALESVENRVGKMISDVVTDVKETIDCTILAVEKVFSFGGIFRRSSEYEQRCKGETEVKIPPTSPPELRYDSYTHVSEIQHAPEMSHKISNVIKTEISKDLGATDSNVNQTVNNLFVMSGAHEEIDKAQNTIKGHTNRLTEIHASLNKEVNDLSGTLKVTQLENLHLGPKSTVDNVLKEIKLLKEGENTLKPAQLENLHINQTTSKVDSILTEIKQLKESEPAKLDRIMSSVDNVFKEIKLLREDEKSNENINDRKEIRQVLNEVFEVKHADNPAIMSNEHEVEVIINDLKKLSNKTFTDIEKNVSQWNKDEKQILQTIETKVSDDAEKFMTGDAVIQAPKTFKEVAKSLYKLPLPLVEDAATKSDDSHKESESTEISIDKTQEELQRSDELPILEEPTDLSQLDTSVLNSFFAPASEDSKKDAANLIQKSQFANTVMKNFFNRARDDDVPSVFDNSDFFNFDDE